MYEYDIDNEIVKIGKSLFKFVFRVGDISWVQNTISEYDYLLSVFFE
jgi:hypothetical protein